MVGGSPLSHDNAVVGEAMARLAEENALLRASIAEMRARLEEMEKASERDALTGLPNRPSFMRALDRAVSRANRHGTPAALLYLDVDGLEAINARHGQIAGDAALIHLAKLLQDLVRTTDVAARVGGDEFAIILDHLDGDSAIETSERIGRCVADHPLDLGAGTLPIRVSIGIATILRGDTVEDVIRRGELTMHKAKSF
jgi:diguanylate cyclase (GGDEF)-like protein